MTKEDLCAIQTFYPAWYKELKPKNIVVLSPEQEKTLIYEILGTSNIDILTIDEWNLDTKINKKYC